MRAAVLGILLAVSSPALADGDCLTPAQRANVLATGQVVSLAKVLQTVRVRRAELVNAKLCRQAKGLVYLLTVLRRDGKVVRISVDAGDGRLIGSR